MCPLQLGSYVFEKSSMREVIFDKFCNSWENTDMGPYLDTKYSSCLVCDALTLDR